MRGRKMQRSGAVHIPEKSRQYFRMLCDSTQFFEAGVPGGIPTPSLKTHCFARGSLSIGTSSVGFISLAPWQGCSNTQTCGFFTGPNFAGNSFTNVAAALSVIAYNTNSPYASTDIGAAPLAQYRLISACLRVRYTGTELTMGGTVHALHHPEQESLNGVTIAGLDLYRQTSRFPVSREWVTVNYCPSQNAITYFEDPNPATAFTFMGIMVDGTAGNTFDWEMYGNYEFVGRNIRGQTPSHNDSVALATAQSTMSHPPFGVTNEPPEKHTSEMQGIFNEVLKEGTTYVVKAAADSAIAAFKASVS